MRVLELPHFGVTELLQTLTSGNAVDGRERVSDGVGPQGGLVLCKNGGPVSWKSTKQKSVSLSTAESEWYAASEAGKEIIYLRRILDDFGFEQKGPTTLYEDSRAVICMAENPVNRKSSRHIDTRRHFIGELVAAGTVKLADCRTDEMVADALTKSLPYPSFKKHRATMMGEEVKQAKVYQIVMQVG